MKTSLLYKKLFSFTVMLEKFPDNKQKMWKQIEETFDLQALQVLSWNTRAINLAARKFDFLRYQKLFKSVFFYFLSSEIYVSGHIRKFCFLIYKQFFFFSGGGGRGVDFYFRKYRKTFILRKYNSFFNIGVRKFCFPGV